MIDTQLKETLAFIQKQTLPKPRLAFVLGSGLSGFAKHVKVTAEFKFGDLPHFECSGVEGHPGRLTFGELEGVSVVLKSPARLIRYRSSAAASCQRSWPKACPPWCST